MDPENTEKTFSRVLAVVVVSEVLIGVGAFLFLSSSAQNAIAGFRTFLAGNPAALVLPLVMVLVSIALLIVRFSTQMPPTLTDLSKGIPIHFKRRRGNIGKPAGASLFGVELYFEGRYHDARVRYSEAKSGRGGNSLRKLSILHPRDLGLGFLCSYPDGVVDGLLSASEARELAAQRLDMDGEGLKLWSVQKEKALSLFSETDVSATMGELTRLIDDMSADSAGAKMGCGFFMNDVGITVVLADRYRPEKALLDAMVRLSRAAAASPIVSKTSTQKPDHPLEAATARLLLFMVVILAFLAMG